MSVWVNDGGADGTNFTMFKGSGGEGLLTFISGRLGYRLGRDLFALPYDFRQDLTGMAASGELRRLANKIEAAVAANCGKKAILIGHSMGGLVGLALLRNPGLEAWR
jgi:pimeloyl-ACP methyl ester carboxylesterase